MAARTRTKRSAPVASAPVAALADTPVGPALATTLATLTLNALTGFETVLVLKARQRQSNHDRGMLLATIGEVMRRNDPGLGPVDDAEAGEERDKGQRSGARDSWDEVGANEIRAALMLTRRSANTLAALARDLVGRLPAVLQAMIDGVLDQPRARIFSDYTSQLSHEHARAVVHALLPAAANLTTAQLIEAISKAAIELDPDWARRRYERALRGRRVEGVIGPDGTATLTGHQLPADQVAAACDRLDAIARHLKRAGHPHPINHIRADIFLGKLTGAYAAMNDEQLLTHLLAHMPPRPAPDPTPSHRPPTSPDISSDGDGPDGDRDGATTENDGEAATGDDNPTDTNSDTGGADHSAEEGSSDDGANGFGAEHDAGPNGDGGGGSGGSGSGGSGAVSGDSGGGAEGDGSVRGRGLRLLTGLGTIAGLDRRTSQLLGWGPVHAELARTISSTRHASWWYVLVEPDGTPLDVGPIRPRPTKPWAAGPAPQYRDVEVWLRVTRAELAALVDQPPPGWERLLANTADRIASRPGAPPNGDPTDRLPNAALRRWISIRDQRCVFPGCRVAPHRCDVDHTIEHATGGPTSDTNLAAACRPDHALRHRGGWSVTQHKPGHVTWISPLGHRYRRIPPPGPDKALAPMANPTHPDDDLHVGVHIDHNASDWDTDSCLHTPAWAPQPTSKPEPDHLPQPQPKRLADDTPPF